jgi:uncharacterized protein YkwD
MLHSRVGTPGRRRPVIINPIAGAIGTSMKRLLPRAMSRRVDHRLRTYGVTAALGVFSLSAVVPQCAPPPAVVQVANVQDSMATGVNHHRSRAGLSPVSVDYRLTAAAQGHSDHMARQQLMTHVGAGWTDAGQRVTNAGYPWTVWAENVAAGQRTPDQVLHGWLNSKGHRENILRAGVVHIGVAAATGANGVTYWTMVVAARR